MVTIKCIDEPFKKEKLNVEVQGDVLILTNTSGERVASEEMEEVIEKIQLRGMSGDTRHIVLPYKGGLLRFKQQGKAINYLQNAVDIQIAQKHPESVDKIKKKGLSQIGTGVVFVIPAIVLFPMGIGGGIGITVGIFFLIGIVGVGMGLTNFRRSQKIRKMIETATV